MTRYKDLLCKNNTDVLIELTDIPSMKKYVGKILEEKLSFCYSRELYFYIMDKKIISLGFRHINLSKIPESIFRLDSLKELNLENNRLYEIADSISKLKNLRRLGVACNRISHISENLNELTLLEALELQRNRLKKIPENLSNLSNLESMNLSRNNLQELPESILTLKKLKYLEISYNRNLIIPTKYRDQLTNKGVKLIENMLGKKIIFNQNNPYNDLGRLKSHEYLRIIKEKFGDKEVIASVNKVRRQDIELFFAPIDDNVYPMKNPFSYIEESIVGGLKSKDQAFKNDTVHLLTAIFNELKRVLSFKITDDYYYSFYASSILDLFNTIHIHNCDDQIFGLRYQLDQLIDENKDRMQRI